jgi:hypothetical protein
MVLVVGHSWNPALPGAIAALVYFHARFVRKFLQFLIDLSLSSILIFPPAFSVYLNSGTTAASVGSLSYSQILTVFLGIGLMVSFYFLLNGVSLYQQVLASLALGNLLFASFIKLISGASLFEIPYYSLKLMWLSSIPLLLCLGLQMPIQGTRKNRKIKLLLTSLLLSSLLLSNLTAIFPGKEKAISFFNPSNYELLWQARALFFVAGLKDAQPYVIFSGSVWDSRSAQFSSILGRNTWSAINGLQVDTNALCRFVSKNDDTLIISRETVVLPNCNSKLVIVNIK